MDYDLKRLIDQFTTKTEACLHLQFFNPETNQVESTLNLK